VCLARTHARIGREGLQRQLAGSLAELADQREPDFDRLDAAPFVARFALPLDAQDTTPVSFLTVFDVLQ
jgi:hypothetical protein